MKTYSLKGSFLNYTIKNCNLFLWIFRFSALKKIYLSSNLPWQITCETKYNLFLIFFFVLVHMLLFLVSPVCGIFIGAFLWNVNSSLAAFFSPCFAVAMLPDKRSSRFSLVLGKRRTTMGQVKIKLSVTPSSVPRWRWSFLLPFFSPTVDFSLALLLLPALWYKANILICTERGGLQMNGLSLNFHQF